MPGRLQVVAHEPLTVLDGAHNPSGVAALAESLPELTPAGALVAVVSILDDKDAAGMLRALLPHCRARRLHAQPRTRARCRRRRSSRCARQLGGRAVRAGRPTRGARSQRARELAGAGGAVLVTGSIYLVADLLAPSGQRGASML